jgi:hypothetical protein
MVSHVSPKATKNPGWLFYFRLGFIALIYGAAGLMKVTAAPAMVARLNELHFNGTWKLFIVINELPGAAGLVLPRTRVLASPCLRPYPNGGLPWHILFSHPASRIARAVLAAILMPMA